MAPVEWEGKYFTHIFLIVQYYRDGSTRLPIDCEKSDGFGHCQREPDGCEVFDIRGGVQRHIADLGQLQALQYDGFGDLQSVRENGKDRQTPNLEVQSCTWSTSATRQDIVKSP